MIRVVILQSAGQHSRTSSCAVAERPLDALWPSVVSFNSEIPQVQSFIIVT